MGEQIGARPTLYVMVGIPGSGKSNYAQRLAKRNHAVVHSSDAIRGELFGRETSTSDPAAVFAVMLKRTLADLSAGVSVVYDATNINGTRRKSLLQAVSHENPETVCVVLDTPISTCFSRNANRARKVPERVIRRMAEAMERPGLSEGWDRIDLVRA